MTRVGRYTQSVRSLPLLAAVLALGCSLLESVDGYEGPAAGGASGGASGGTSGGTSGGGTGGVIGKGGGWATGGSGGSNAGSAGVAAGGAGACSTACSDGDACNGVETCNAGQCVPGVPPTVDDGNSCTTDYCDSKTGVAHVMGSYPSIKQCIAMTDVCPTDYFRSEYTCCDPECGACPYFVNAQFCQRACAAEIQICCGDLQAKCAGLSCPGGYTKTGEVGANCVCGTAGFAVVCKR